MALWRRFLSWGTPWLHCEVTWESRISKQGGDTKAETPAPRLFWCVLVPYCCCNKLLPMWWLETTQVIHLPALEVRGPGWSQRTKVKPGAVSCLQGLGAESMPQPFHACGCITPGSVSPTTSTSLALLPPHEDPVRTPTNPLIPPPLNPGLSRSSTYSHLHGLFCHVREHNHRWQELGHATSVGGSLSADRVARSHSLAHSVCSFDTSGHVPGLRWILLGTQWLPGLCMH